MERCCCTWGKREFWIGVRDSIPLIVGVIPFGITCGIMALAAGLTTGETIFMSMFVFAGAAQFIAITMLGAGVSGWGIIVSTTLLINLRHLLMGASLAPYIIRLPIFLQAFLSFGMVDETYAVLMNRIQKKGYDVAYQTGANVAFYSSWVLSTAVGVLLSGYISDPLAWGLDFAMPAIFLAMLIPRLISPTALVVCGVAAVVAVLGALYLPGKWYIMIACLAAIVVGGIMEGGQPMRSEIVLLIIGMAVVTFFTRFASVMLFRQTGVPDWFEHWMKHVPTGILTALIIPTLLLPKGHLDISFQNHYLLAGVVAALAAYRYRNVIVTMGFGLVTMLSMRWFGI